MLSAMTGSAGRVPLRIRVGVTGHRTLDDEPAVAARVDDILSRLQSMLPSTSTTSVLYEVVSPLGEGADRLVADRVLRVPSAVLEVPLPLPPEDYALDFESEASRRRFGALLERADLVWVVGGSDRVDAYRESGEYVVDSCDVLIAIWDGKPSRGTGGTADILERARTREMPVFLVDAEAPFDVSEEHMPVSLRLFGDVDRYNRVEVPKGSGAVMPLSASSVAAFGVEGSALERCLSWFEIPFRRADAAARRYRVTFLWTSRLLFLMSAVATLAIAVSVAFESRNRDIARTFASLEVALMVAALALWLLVRRRLHGRWIAIRFLAERLRSAVFLAFVGSPSDPGSRAEGDYRAGEQEWLTRVFREVWRSRPAIDHSGLDVEKVKDLVRRGWVDPQAAYYRRRSRDHAFTFRILTAASAFLFLAAIAAAVGHASEQVHGTMSRVVVMLSIALPAFAGALAGIAALEQHARHGERFALMARRLDELGDRLRRATDLERVRDVALRIEAELRTEGDEWVDVMRFQDVELPV
jgi:SMODS and SLOG-associating 2TM effector domain 1